VLVSLFLFGNAEESYSETRILSDAKYDIIKDEKKRNIKRTVEVVLATKVSKETLKELAYAIKHSDRKAYKRVFIGYFLAGKDKKNGFWARTDFRPDLEVRIIGLSIEDELALVKKAPPDPEKEVIGSWLDDRPGIGARMILFYKDKALYLENTYSDGSSRAKEMVEHSDPRGRRLDAKGGNAFGEYFLLNAINELEFWDRTGNYYTAKRLP